MFYQNPVLSGFYPDPSVVKVGEKFFLVCSTFQYFPGIALFESENLIQWEAIGSVLTRKSQVMLDKVESSGGVFAPTIRHHNGRFYVVTTNNTTHENFYVYTDDIYGEWSEPVIIQQDGIDPSLLFDGDTCYFISNGTDSEGNAGVVQCEINIATGEKLSPSRRIWSGNGGRFLESPHMYKIGDYYYLMAAEGGTEYGHMITLSRSHSPWGPFISCPHNPILTNRNKAPFQIQGVGHGDLVEKDGSWYILCLGFRQQGEWSAFHHLGRETFLAPVHFSEDGWFTVGKDGTMDFVYPYGESSGDSFVPSTPIDFTYQGEQSKAELLYLRHPNFENYQLKSDKIILHGSNISLNECDSPTFLAVRQKEFNGICSVVLSLTGGIAGVSVYSNETEHFDLCLEQRGTDYFGVLRLNAFGIHHIEKEIKAEHNAVLSIRFDAYSYHFYLNDCYMGSCMSKILANEISSPFTGTVLAVFAEDSGKAEFENFNVKYEKKEEYAI